MAKAKPIWIEDAWTKDVKFKLPSRLTAGCVVSWPWDLNRYILRDALRSKGLRYRLITTEDERLRRRLWGTFRGPLAVLEELPTKVV